MRREDIYNDSFLTVSTKIGVVIATMGRPEVVSQTLNRILSKQTLKPETVIVSCPTQEDAGETATWPEVKILLSQPGLAAQRNVAISALSNTVDIIVFFDDDFVPERDWLEVAARRFQEDRNIVGLTGDVIADGIKGPGFSFAQADGILNATKPMEPSLLIERFSPYGCNMAFRQSAIGSLRFDERLVLYGWLEDRDFGAALAATGGRIVKCLEARGIHLGVKRGRIGGDRLGYSQVVNPLYMLRKGTMTYSQVVDHLFRNIASNLIGSIFPEPFIDRRGRLRGNMRAAVDLIKGHLEPERVLLIQRSK